MEGLNVYVHGVEMAGVVNSFDGETYIVLLRDDSYCQVSPEMIEVLH